MGEPPKSTLPPGNFLSAAPLLHRTPDRTRKEKSPRHIQNKEGIFKAAREKDQVTYKGRPIRITLDFSVETLNDNPDDYTRKTFHHYRRRK